MPYLTRSVKRVRLKNVRGQALEIAVFYSGYIPWYEAVKVGVTCKELQHVWQEEKNHLCEPVLEALNELQISTNVCQTCDKVAFPVEESQCPCSAQDRDIPFSRLDPRFNEESYRNLSTWEKCKSLVNFAATCVSNFQSNFDYNNIASRDGIPPVFRFDWQNRECRFLAEHKPRRLAFMVNLLAAVTGHCILYGKEHVLAFYNQPFAGNGFAQDEETAARFRAVVEESISGLCPLADDGFTNLTQNIHNKYGKVWEILGLVLTRKLHFMIPFLLGTEEGTWIANITDDLEPVDPQADALALSLFV